jgi:hypothetical protein
MSINQIKDFAAIGSSTAKAVLEQMASEAYQAQQEKENQAQATKEQTATERNQKIAAAQFEIDEGLQAYEEFRKLAQTALNKAFAASFQLPAGVIPRHPFDFLKKVNLLPAFPGPNDELWPVFSTTEQYLHQVIAGKR